jgi:hypothetical protein
LHVSSLQHRAFVGGVRWGPADFWWCIWGWWWYVVQNKWELEWFDTDMYGRRDKSAGLSKSPLKRKGEPRGGKLFGIRGWDCSQTDMQY